MNRDNLSSELSFRFSRASGKGGQNVNKVETRVELLFDVAGSAGLSEEEKELILQRLANRINQEGVLLVAAEQFRSQHKNRKEAVNRFFELLETALQPEAPRTGPVEFKAKPKVRLQKKKAQGQKKAMRKKGAALLDEAPLSEV